MRCIKFLFLAITICGLVQAEEEVKAKEEEPAQEHSMAFNGEPGCKTSCEIDRQFRNFWDPTRYFVCQHINNRAVAKNCLTNRAFLQSREKCVPWSEWSYERPLVMPPSCPNGANECTPNPCAA